MGKILTPVGMDNNGQFRIANQGDSMQLMSNTSQLQKGNGAGILIDAVAGTDFVSPSVSAGSSWVLFVGTADSILTNSVTETSIVPTGVGTLTAPANFLVAGKTLRGRISGIYTTPAIGTPSVLIKIKLGSTVIGSVTTSSLAVGITGARFWGDCIITCRSAGTSGVLSVDSGLIYNTSGDVIVSDAINNGGATVGIDTTTSQTFNVTATWDSSSTTRIIKVTNFTLESLN